MTHSPFLPQPERSAPPARTPAVLRKSRRETLDFWFLILFSLKNLSGQEKDPEQKRSGSRKPFYRINLYYSLTVRPSKPFNRIYLMTTSLALALRSSVTNLKK